MKYLILLGWPSTLALVYFLGARVGYVCGWKDRGYKPHQHAPPAPLPPQPPKYK